MVQHAALAVGLLRAHVAERAEDVAGHGEVGPVWVIGQPEVGDPEVPAGIDHQVRRLDVAVDDAHLVGMFQGLGRLDAPLGHRAEEFRQPVVSLVEMAAWGSRLVSGARGDEEGSRGSGTRGWGRGFRVQGSAIRGRG